MNKVMQAYQSISSYLSAIEFYNMILQMVNDATKFLCGYENFSEKRKEYLANLKSIHGFSLFEFLNYLISRDKFIDKIGIQSDLIILHYKFGSNGFIPKQPEISFKSSFNTIPITQTVSSSKNTSTSAPPLSHANLLKMSKADMCRILREQRNNQKPGKKKIQKQYPLIGPYLKMRDLEKIVWMMMFCLHRNSLINW